MKRIWKFPLEVTDVQTVDIPRDHDTLCVQVQRGVPCLWAMVDDAVERTPARFRIVGTGHPAPDCIDSCDYVDTFQLQDGALVFHVFRDWSRR